MEFDCSLDQANLNRPFGDWSTSAGCKLLMSHEWPYHFEEITQRYSDAWVQLIYRPDLQAFYGGNKQADLTLHTQTTTGTKMKRQ